jgi:hypothetical protein
MEISESLSAIERNVILIILKSFEIFFKKINLNVFIWRLGESSPGFIFLKQSSP